MTGLGLLKAKGVWDFYSFETHPEPTYNTTSQMTTLASLAYIPYTYLYYLAVSCHVDVIVTCQQVVVPGSVRED